VDDLSHVLWLGGPSASGKSTVGRLARRNGLRWYSCDTRTWVHRDRTVADGHPGVIQWAAMTVDERQAAQDQGRTAGGDCAPSRPPCGTGGMSSSRWTTQAG
jgi:hypothetical protein